MKNCKKRCIVFCFYFLLASCFPKEAQKVDLQNPPQDENLSAAEEQSPYSKYVLNYDEIFVSESRIKLNGRDSDYVFVLREYPSKIYSGERKGQTQRLKHGDIFNEYDVSEKYYIAFVSTFSELDMPIRDSKKKLSFFTGYENSYFCKAFSDCKVEGCTVFIKDIDNDGNEEILAFPLSANVNYPNGERGLDIYKYIDNEWKIVFSKEYFGFFAWNYPAYFSEPSHDDPHCLDPEWFEPKPFPYDFVEYKGKVGLRIVCYDRPREWSSHYHAQFWAYDEEAQEYKMLEEVWESIEHTPADGLIFAEAPDFMPVTEPKFSLLGLKLTAADLEGMDKERLRLMRNAVYARHGRTFKSKDLQSLFNGYVWYRPNSKYSDGLLTETDRENISLIQEFENR